MEFWTTIPLVKPKVMGENKLGKQNQFEGCSSAILDIWKMKEINDTVLEIKEIPVYENIDTCLYPLMEQEKPKNEK